MTIPTRVAHSARNRHLPRHLGGLMLLARLSPAMTLADAGPEAAGQPAAGLVEIVVTAERRESNLQTTPIAVTALDAPAIAALAPRTLGDMAMLVPNFSANKINGFNGASFFMRGVGKTDIIVYHHATGSVYAEHFFVPRRNAQLLVQLVVAQ